MEVKCPKCRFKFDMTAAPGIKELACVCPRCGVPFTYTVPEDAELTSADVEEVQTDSVEPQPTDAQPQPTYVPQPQADELKAPSANAPRPYEAGRVVMPVQNTLHEAGVPKSDDRRDEPQKKSHGCLRGCLIVLVVLFIAVVFGIRSCNHRDKSYSADDVSNNEVINASDGSETAPDTASVDKDDFSEVHAETPPKWIQGKWEVDTEYGGITLTVNGKKVIETAGGRTSKGTFYFEKGCLVCDYGDGSILIYKVDDERRMIDAGNGMFMHRVK